MRLFSGGSLIKKDMCRWPSAGWSQHDCLRHRGLQGRDHQFMVVKICCNDQMQPQVCETLGTFTFLTYIDEVFDEYLARCMTFSPRFPLQTLKIS